jgi:hypothetical protein
MSRNRTHGLFVQGGVRLDHLADVILSRYPNARLTENMVRLDLGVPVPQTVVAPVTDAESATHFHLPKMEEFRGRGATLDRILNELVSHPEVLALHSSFEKKRDANVAAGRKAAQFEDAEREELQNLLATDQKVPAWQQDVQSVEYDKLRRAYELACDRLVALGEHPPTVD